MLTTAQLQTIKAWIIANRNSVFDQSAAEALNATASPAFNVYRSVVSQDEIMLNGFDWARVDNLSVGKARCWEWLFNNELRSINPSKSNIRTGINTVWVGTQADLAVRAAVYVHCYRLATVAEKLFATGSGTTPNATGDGPATLGFEGEVTLQDVVNSESA